MSEYQALLTRLGLKVNIQNPACFLENQNVVVVGTELARLAAKTHQITYRTIACGGTSAIWKPASRPSPQN